MKTSIVCCLFALLAVTAAYAYTIPEINIGPWTVVYGWGATAVGGSYNSIFDTSLGGDQTYLLQQSFNTVAQKGGGTVTILSGTYILQGNLEIYSNTHVQGQGIDITILKLIDFSTDFYYAGFIHLEKSNDVIISQLTIDGNKAFQGTTDVNTYGKYGIYTEASTSTWFDHIRVTQMNHYGFDPHGLKSPMIWGQNLTITNCIADNNGWDGFTMDQTLNIVAENNQATANGRHGFNVVTGSSQVLLQNNVAINNGFTYVPGAGGCGIAVQNDFGFNTNNVQIISNTITNNDYAGICLNNVTDITISNNQIIDNCICVDILNGGNTAIDNNVCTGLTFVTGIDESYTSANNIFTAKALCSVIDTVSQLTYLVGYNLPPSNTTFSIVDPMTARSVIQLALDTISQNNGGIVTINPGVYSIDGTIEVSSRTHLQGSGIYQTTLMLTNNAATFLNGNAGFIRTRLTDSVTISDMTLDGNLINQCCNPPCTYGRTGIFVEGSSNFIAENVWTTNFQLNGIDLHGWESGNIVIWGKDAQIINCISDENMFNGIFLNMMDTVNVTGSTMSSNGEDGLLLNNTVNFLGEDNNFINNGYVNTGCGFLVSETPDNEVGVSNGFNNNYLAGNKKGGICINEADVNMEENFLNNTCICYNFASPGITTIMANNVCNGFKPILSTPIFTIPLNNIYNHAPCPNIAVDLENLQCVNGYYIGASSAGGSTADGSTATVSTAGDSTGTVSTTTGATPTGPTATGATTTAPTVTGSTSTGSTPTSSTATGSTATSPKSSSTGSKHTNSATTDKISQISLISLLAASALFTLS
ncbi:MAG: hypothetical protein Hyperionvirus2_19 [Hyperionvirus sp.]|uniref:Right handed beta helix domain-containing protein n=1 Tax=Hyperionvirus sp. TaxID=2487770 RepID=A0A3G5A8Z6_9VIRU|nr:MAG: hypothetical protein Hyperionvirus2_19 [Hyperionvirus sp.]